MIVSDIIDGISTIASWITKFMKGRQAIIHTSMEGCFPKQHVVVSNYGSHVAKDLEITITGCHSHDCPRQDLNPGDDIPILLAIDKDTREVCVDCSWTDGRKGSQNYHRVLMSR